MKKHRRSAVLILPFNDPVHGIQKDTKVACHVHGFFQAADDELLETCFVVELPNGQYMYAPLQYLTFVDKEEVIQYDDNSN